MPLLTWKQTNEKKFNRISEIEIFVPASFDAFHNTCWCDMALEPNIGRQPFQNENLQKLYKTLYKIENIIYIWKVVQLTNYMIRFWSQPLLNILQ